ncbi:helix-turn-helix domain-containing protein [Nonomuraea bangladeshensis]|uniref:helix-turn-helix domain-containing protein n=1 Tax=Nonomuraea bangladeshensis TaxID=404385 RepID=UPI003C2D342D
MLSTSKGRLARCCELINSSRDKFIAVLLYHQGGSVVAVGRKKREASQYADQAARLSRHLKVLRVDAGYTQEQLAMRANVTLATLRKIETGRTVEPGYFTVLALIRALGIQPGEFSIAVSGLDGKVDSADSAQPPPEQSRALP